MDVEGILWIILWSVIAIVSGIKLRTSSSSPQKPANQDDDDSRRR